MSTPQRVAADITNLGFEAAAKAHAITVRWTAALQRQVQLNASGRPGPNAPTGNYRRSINRRTVKLARSSYGEVGTNMPQGRRLEFGFTGEDSLGRSYSQPPYPHFGPALDFVADGYEHALAEAGVPSSRRGPGVSEPGA